MHARRQGVASNHAGEQGVCVTGPFFEIAKLRAFVFDNAGTVLTGSAAAPRRNASQINRLVFCRVPGVFQRFPRFQIVVNTGGPVSYTTLTPQTKA